MSQQSAASEHAIIGGALTSATPIGPKAALRPGASRHWSAVESLFHSHGGGSGPVGSTRTLKLHLRAPRGLNI